MRHGDSVVFEHNQKRQNRKARGLRVVVAQGWATWKRRETLDIESF